MPLIDFRRHKKTLKVSNLNSHNLTFMGAGQGLLFWSSCGGNHGQTFFRTGKQFFLKLREGLVMKVFG